MRALWAAKTSSPGPTAAWAAASATPRSAGPSSTPWSKAPVSPRASSGAASRPSKRRHAGPLSAAAAGLLLSLQARPQSERSNLLPYSGVVSLKRLRSLRLHGGLARNHQQSSSQHDWTPLTFAQLMQNFRRPHVPRIGPPLAAKTPSYSVRNAPEPQPLPFEPELIG